MLVDAITNWRNYGFGPVWEDVMTWLETAFRTGDQTGRNPHRAYSSPGSPALEDGVHALGEARVTVTSRVTRLRSEARYETHRQLCDVHLVLAGREGFCTRRRRTSRRTAILTKRQTPVFCNRVRRNR